MINSGKFVETKAADYYSNSTAAAGVRSKSKLLINLAAAKAAANKKNSDPFLIEGKENNIHSDQYDSDAEFEEQPQMAETSQNSRSFLSMASFENVGSSQENDSDNFGTFFSMDGMNPTKTPRAQTGLENILDSNNQRNMFSKDEQNQNSEKTYFRQKSPVMNNANRQVNASQGFRNGGDSHKSGDQDLNLNGLNEQDFDGLTKDLVALDLNVDNHLNLNNFTGYNRPEFAMSGKSSMTPNPRSGYKSPARNLVNMNSLETMGNVNNLLLETDCLDNLDEKMKSLSVNLFNEKYLKLTSATPPAKRSSPLHNNDMFLNPTEHILSPPARVATYKANSKLKSRINYDSMNNMAQGSMSPGLKMSMSFNNSDFPNIKPLGSSSLNVLEETSPANSLNSNQAHGDNFSFVNSQNFGQDYYPQESLFGQHVGSDHMNAVSMNDYSNLQPMQQITLPNGMQALVVPMLNHNPSSSSFQQDDLGNFGQGGSRRNFNGEFNNQNSSSFHHGSMKDHGSFNFGHLNHSQSFNVASVSQVSRAGMKSPAFKSNLNPNTPPFTHSGYPDAASSSLAPLNLSLNSTTGAIPAETPLTKFAGQIFQLSQEQNGCRYLQQKVDMEKEAACIVIIHEVRNRLVQLMMDPFGNYLFQKLLEHVSKPQRLDILQRVRGHLVQAALNLHGTRSVQKFIEVSGRKSELDKDVDLDQLSILVECLSPYITKLSMDTNGNHVVQRCLQFMPVEIAQFVYDAAIRDVLVITRHRHGCCVFQRCIDSANEVQRRALVGEVVSHAIQLMQDPFGNYVVQYVLDNARKDETDALVAQLMGMLPQLSMQKFSSNVVEKCLLAAPAIMRSQMIEELANVETMRNLLHDQYANYVVQRALLVADDDLGMRLVKSIRPHIADLGQFNPSCARRVTNRVIKRFPALANDIVFASFWQNDTNSLNLNLNSLN